MHEIRLVEGFPEAEMPAICDLARQIGSFDEAMFRQALADRPLILSCFAVVDGGLAGYKVGYQDRPRYFESWQGGVAPHYRRRGLAAAMMERQHRWCREQGFMLVSTITEGSNQPMLIANLRAGFEVCGTFLDRRKILKVLLQKQLG